MKKEIRLFNRKKDCCACGACYNICPKNAIEMIIDEYGFKYPKIDKGKCIECGACMRVCAFQYIEETNIIKEVFVSARKDNNKIIQSASGGIFAVFAEKFLGENGIVCGAALVSENNNLEPKHVSVDELKNLPKLLGSKYVQSDINTIYKDIKKYLLSDKKVLFSGTPCQVAGLKSFLGKSYDNLLTIDIICHGVPNAEFFKGYLKLLEKKYRGKVIDFKFRDKKNGWGLNSCLKYIDINGKIKYKYFLSSESTYYHMFLQSESYRENCYKCKYTNANRAGDITIGDYWGVEKEHPYLLKENGGVIDKHNGISVIIVNTDKGKIWLNRCSDELYLYSSTFEQAAKFNMQLQHPSLYGTFRERIMDLYKKEGYEAVDNFYYNNVLKKVIIKEKIKKFIPKKIKQEIKKIINYFK